MSLILNLENLHTAGDTKFRIFLSKGGPSGQAVLSRRMQKGFSGQYVIVTMADKDNLRYELEDLAITAFEMGRTYQKSLQKKLPAPKKRR